jgi:addiction module HigA family antidote
MANITLKCREMMLDWSVHPGAVVKEHLEERGLSQAEFARLAELSPKLVSDVIRGVRPISARTAARLQLVLGIESTVWHLIQTRWNLLQTRTALFGPVAPRANGSRRTAARWQTRRNRGCVAAVTCSM